MNEEAHMKEYLLLLDADQFLRERSYAGGKAIGDFQVWLAIKNAKYQYYTYWCFCNNSNPSNYEEIKNDIAYYKTQAYKSKSIIPINDWTLKVDNKLNQDFGLPYLEEQVITACRNKSIMKSI